MAASSFILIPALKESRMAPWRCRYEFPLWASAPSVFSAVFPTHHLLALDTCSEPSAGTQSRARSQLERWRHQANEQNAPMCLASPQTLCPSTAFQAFMALPPSPTQSTSRHRAPQVKEFPHPPTCVTGFQPRAPAGPISGSTPPSSGCKSLRGTPSGLSGSAHGSFLGSVVEKTGNGEQERQLRLLPLALPLPP